MTQRYWSECANAIHTEESAKLVKVSAPLAASAAGTENHIAWSATRHSGGARSRARARRSSITIAPPSEPTYAIATAASATWVGSSGSPRARNP